MNPELVEGDWPPSWFGVIRNGRPDTASQVDKILAEGFGQS